MLFVVGYHASGKSHFARILEQQYNAMHIETSVVVKEFKLQDAPDASLGEWARMKEAEFGSTFFDEIIVMNVRKRYLQALEEGNDPKEIIITGNRSLNGIKYAAEQLADLHSRPTKIFAVDVDEDVRLQRFRERNRREGDATMSSEGFQKLIREEQDTGIDEIFINADLILSNNETPEIFDG